VLQLSSAEKKDTHILTLITENQNLQNEIAKLEAEREARKARFDSALADS